MLNTFLNFVLSKVYCDLKTECSSDYVLGFRIFASGPKLHEVLWYSNQSKIYKKFRLAVYIYKNILINIK